MAFVGEVHYSKGVFCGVIVTGSGGKNNGMVCFPSTNYYAKHSWLKYAVLIGTIKGHKYFTCAEKKGLMVKLDEVRRV